MSRTVKVSVFCNSPISKDQASPGGRVKQLQQSQLIHVDPKEEEKAENASINTPNDCYCVNLSPALSLESHEEDGNADDVIRVDEERRSDVEVPPPPSRPILRLSGE